MRTRWLISAAKVINLSGADGQYYAEYSHWFGVTFKEDQAGVEESFRKLIENGVYRADLYSDL